MTEIERKALALLNEVRAERGYDPWSALNRKNEAMREAICRAIEAHEAFKQEVSDALAYYITQWSSDPLIRDTFSVHFARFILPKPDPLVEALAYFKVPGEYDGFSGEAERLAAAFRKALAKRNGRIVFDD